MWIADYLAHKGYTNFNRAYQGEELVWEKWDYSDAFWVENINDYPIIFSVNESCLINEKKTESINGDVLFSFDNKVPFLYNLHLK